VDILLGVLEDAQRAWSVWVLFLNA
jgi:hypothetical protein